jgi:hypothetical protein
MIGQIGAEDQPFFFFFFFARQAIVPLELLHQPFFVMGFFKIESQGLFA